MALDAGLPRDDGLRGLAGYHLPFYTGARIGHCAPPSSASHHALRLSQVGEVQSGKSYFHKIREKP